MVCKVCNHNNKDGAMFCANCGYKMIQPTDVIDPERTIKLDEMGMNTGELYDSDDEMGRTDVLTQPNVHPSEVLTHPTPPAGSGPLPGPSFGSGPLPGPTPPPMAPKMPPKMPQANLTGQNKPKSTGGNGGGWKGLAIVASILVLACVGVGIFGYLTLSKKANDNQDAKEKAEADYAELKTKYDELETSSQGDLDDAQKEAQDAQKETQAAEDRAKSVEDEFQSYKDKYDTLIAFADKNTGKGTESVFVSASTLKLEKDGMMLWVYAPEDANLSCSSDNTGVASAQVQKYTNGLFLATFKKGSAGSAVVTITNEDSKKSAQVYVFVD